MFKQNKKYFFQNLDGANLNSVDNFRTLVMNKVTDYKCVFFLDNFNEVKNTNQDFLCCFLLHFDEV